MRSLFFAMIVIFSCVSIASAQIPQKQEEVPTYLQSVSVTIKAKGSQGSGVIITKDGANFVVTAAHVIDGVRRVRETIKEGKEVKLVEFDDVIVMQVIIHEGRTVGRVEYNAKVIKYSDADFGYDVAVLQLRNPKAFDKYVEFYKDTVIPPIASNLYHCGSLLGEMGANSVTKGSLSQHGRLHGKRVLDQVNVGSFPGSSGGGVYDERGYYIGMLVRGAGETYGLITPIRELNQWAKEVGMEWVFDPSRDVPTQSEINKIPVE